MHRMETLIIDLLEGSPLSKHYQSSTNSSEEIDDNNISRDAQANDTFGPNTSGVAQMPENPSSSSPVDRTPYRQTILTSEIVANRRYQNAKKLYSRLLELAYQRFSGLDVARSLGALKHVIKTSGLSRSSEIVRFVSEGNEMAALWILKNIVRYLDETRLELLRERLSREKTKEKVQDKPSGMIEIMIGRFRNLGGVGMSVQKPEPRRLYRWHRIFDEEFASLAGQVKFLKNAMEQLEEAMKLLKPLTLNAAKKAKIEQQLDEILVDVKGSKSKEKKDCVRAIVLAKGFISLGRLNLGQVSIESAFDSLKARLKIVENQMSSLKYLRWRLREIGQTRFERVLRLIQKAREAKSFKDAQEVIEEKVMHLPFLAEPDFIGVRNAALELAEIFYRLEKLYQAYKAQGALFIKEPFRIPKQEQEKTSDNFVLIESIVQQASKTNRFMIAYQTLLHDFYLGKLKRFANEEAVFNKVFCDWSKDNQLVRGSPGRYQYSRFWRAHLYKIVFISERSLCFKACDAILLILKTGHFGKQLSNSRKYHRSNFVRVLAVQLHQKITFAKQVPQEKKDAFVKNLVEAAVKDFDLKNKSEAKDIDSLWKAFGVYRGGQSSSPVVWVVLLWNIW